MTGANKPSEAAERVAVGAASGDPAQLIRDALADAHDPERFEDPREVSVNLGAAVDAIIERYEDTSQGLVCSDFRQAADFLLRRFGGDRG